MAIIHPVSWSDIREFRAEWLPGPQTQAQLVRDLGACLAVSDHLEDTGLLCAQAYGFCASSSHGSVRGICPSVSGQWLSKARSQEAASHPLLRSSADGRAFDSHHPSPSERISALSTLRAPHLPADYQQQPHTQTLIKSGLKIPRKNSPPSRPGFINNWDSITSQMCTGRWRPIVPRQANASSESRG